MFCWFIGSGSIILLQRTAMSGRIHDDFKTKDDDTEISSAPSSRRHPSGRLPYIHKVGKPPKKNLLTEFTTTVKETFFSDDPLRSFKDQPKSRKFMLGIEALFPIFSWARNYSLSKFKGDLIAGFTIASLCIPQVLENFPTNYNGLVW